jgi:hypothetical protein
MKKRRPEPPPYLVGINPLSARTEARTTNDPWLESGAYYDANDKKASAGALALSDANWPLANQHQKH